MNYGQTKFDISPKLVRNQYKKHTGSIYIDCRTTVCITLNADQAFAVMNIGD